MKLLLILLALSLMGARAGANTTTSAGDCQNEAVNLAKTFLETTLKTQWGWSSVHYAQETMQVSPYKVVKNPAFNSQKHEDYILEFVTAAGKDKKMGLKSRFEIQMFANQLTAGDSFFCFTNSFRLSGLNEGIAIQ